MLLPEIGSECQRLFEGVDRGVDVVVAGAAGPVEQRGREVEQDGRARLGVVIVQQSQRLVVFVDGALDVRRSLSSADGQADVGEVGQGGRQVIAVAELTADRQSRVKDADRGALVLGRVAALALTPRDTESVLRPRPLRRFAAAIAQRESPP